MNGQVGVFLWLGNEGTVDDDAHGASAGHRKEASGKHRSFLAGFEKRKICTRLLSGDAKSQFLILDLWFIILGKICVKKERKALCGWSCRTLGKLALNGEYSWYRHCVGLPIQEDFLEVFVSLSRIVFFAVPMFCRLFG